jgi:hypothetical protein
VHGRAGAGVQALGPPVGAQRSGLRGGAAVGPGGERAERRAVAGHRDEPVHRRAQAQPDHAVTARLGGPDDVGERLDGRPHEPPCVELRPPRGRHEERVADAHDVADDGVGPGGDGLGGRGPGVEADQHVHATSRVISLGAAPSDDTMPHR